MVTIDGGSCWASTAPVAIVPAASYMCRAFLRGLFMAKIKNVAVQMDHVSTVTIAGDSRVLP
jgi:hypothetical protein